MDFGSILTRSWKTVWNNKFLIVLGFLAALGGGGGGGNGTNFNFGLNDLDSSRLIADDIVNFLEQYGVLMAALACVGFVISIILWLLRLTAQGGLISAASRIEDGEELKFSDAFSAGTGHLVRLAGLNILMYGPFALLGLVAAAVALMTVGGAVLAELSSSAPDVEAFLGGTAVILFCFACLSCLMVPLIILVTAIYPFAQRGAVLQDLGVVDSVRHGWKILKENLANIILLSLLFLVISLLFGGIVIVVMLPFAVLSFGPAIVDMIANNTVQTRDILSIAGGGICLGLVGAAVNAIMIAFRSTAVTLAYREFTQKSA